MSDSGEPSAGWPIIVAIQLLGGSFLYGPFMVTSGTGKRAGDEANSSAV